MGPWNASKPHRSAPSICKDSVSTNDLSNVQIYKDSNHKPEMAIAITDFEALCGFVPHQELKDALQSVPELRELIGDVTLYTPLPTNLPDDFHVSPLDVLVYPQSQQ